MIGFDSDSLALIAAEVPAWRRAQMEAALEVFESLEEPTGAEEDWRYVELTHSFSDLQPVTKPGDPLPPGPFLGSISESSGRAQVVDGAVVEVASSSMEAITLRDAVAENGLSTLVAPDHNKLAAAHAAFAGDALLLEVPPGRVIEAPFVVEVQGVTPGSASFPHLSVRVGENAEAQIVVLYRSAEGTDLLMVPEVGLHVADGGRLRYLSVQNLDHAADFVIHQRARLARDATCRIGEVGLGASLGRLDLGVSLEGDGCSSEVVGLYFGEGTQTLDYRMVITHVGRNTTSDVFLKGAVEDRAQSVFTGLLRIEKGAQRTSTFETNRNLVLSESAKAHSVPNLEILCDDVVCGHGSSVGPLEDEHLYYLQSRGLSRERAERLLVRGFFREVIDRLPIDDISDPVSEVVFRRFVEAQREGRVA